MDLWIPYFCDLNEDVVVARVHGDSVVEIGCVKVELKRAR